MQEPLVQNVSFEFKKLYGYEPTGVWSAPGRVNLIGEHTDYNEGFVFPFAINRRTFAAISLRDDNIVRVASSFSPVTHEIDVTQIAKNETHQWAAYPFGIAWAIQQFSEVNPTGFDCYIESDVPVGAGLSSSAAIECAVGVALNELWGAGLTKPQLARAGQLAENEIVGAPTGIMDQSASLLGEPDHGVFLDCQSLVAEVVDLGFAKAGLELLIIDTKVAHRHSDGGYASRRAACELGAKVMGVPSLRYLTSADLPKAKKLLDATTFRRVRHVVTENERVIETVQRLKSEGPKAIGDLMYASHASMRDDFEISIEELDLAVTIAESFGAIGSRMTGGGFGGAAIALAPKELIPELTMAIKFGFKKRGFIEPDVFAVSASNGASRAL
jgi:galactokinase